MEYWIERLIGRLNGSYAMACQRVEQLLQHHADSVEQARRIGAGISRRNSSLQVVQGRQQVGHQWLAGEAASCVHFLLDTLLIVGIVSARMLQQAKEFIPLSRLLLQLLEIAGHSVVGCGL